MATHSSTLAWEIPWTEEPGRLQSMGSQRVGHDWATSLTLFTFMYWRRKWQRTPVFLPGESQGWEPGGLPSMGLHRVGNDWRDLAAAGPIQCLAVVKWKKVEVAQSCPTLCDSMDYTVCGIPQAVILEWVTLPFSKGSSQPRDWTQVSHLAGGFFTSWARRETGYSKCSINVCGKYGAISIVIEMCPKSSGETEKRELIFHI